MYDLNAFVVAIEAAMDKWAVPGLSVGLLRQGTVTARAFGVRDLETGDAVTPDTMFGIGSISKVFTATLAVKLADAGRIDLDAPINDVVPADSLPASLASEAVTLRHLLTHTSGLDGDGFADHGAGDDALERYIRSLRDIGLVFAPGAAWSYANIGTCLAGYVLATSQGRSFERLVEEELLRPLGLHRTGFGQSPMPPNVATGYDHGPGEDPRPRPAGTTWRSANPAGGMSSTVHDLLSFAAFHLGDGCAHGQRVIGRERLHAMQGVEANLTTIDAWGIGWALRTVGGRQLIEHGGWMDGYRAQLTLIPDAGAAIAILNNGGYGHAANEEILTLLLEGLFGAVKDAPAAIQVPEEALRAYEGRYTSSHIDVSFRVEDGRLTAHYKTAWHENDGAEMVFDPITPEEFEIGNGEFKGNRIVFLPSLHADRMALRFLNRVLYRQPG